MAQRLAKRRPIDPFIGCPTIWFVPALIVGAWCFASQLAQGHHDLRFWMAFLVGAIPAALLRLHLGKELRHHTRDWVATLLFMSDTLEWDERQIADGQVFLAPWATILIIVLLSAGGVGVAVEWYSALPSLVRQLAQRDAVSALAGLCLGLCALLYLPCLSLWKRADYLLDHPQPSPFLPVDASGEPIPVQPKPRVQYDPAFFLVTLVPIGITATAFALQRPFSVQTEWCLAAGAVLGVLLRLRIWWMIQRFGPDRVAALDYLPAEALPAEMEAVAAPPTQFVRRLVMLAPLFVLQTAMILRWPEASTLIAAGAFSFLILVYPAELSLWRRAWAISREGIATPTLIEDAPAPPAA